MPARKQTEKRPTAVAEHGAAERRLPLPGTPVRVTVRRTNQHTCPVCAQPITEQTGDTEGQEAILCEGSCSAWYHRWCAGVSTQRYDLLSRSEDPFYCQTCTFELQQKSILQLQAEVAALKKEAQDLRSMVATLQEPMEGNCSNASTQALHEEVRDLKAALATMQESYPSNSSRSQPEGETFQESYSWSDVVRRKHGKNKGKGQGGKGVGEKGARSRHEQGSEHSEAQGSLKKSTPAKSTEAKTRSQHPQEQRQMKALLGKRKVWGTMKICPPTAVKGVLTKLANIEGTRIQVKRKYKVGEGGGVTKWWHVVSGDESTMAKLEEEWEKVQMQTSWVIKPCLSYADDTPEGNPSSPIGGTSDPSASSGDSGTSSGSNELPATLLPSSHALVQSHANTVDSPVSGSAQPQTVSQELVSPTHPASDNHFLPAALEDQQTT